MRTHGRPSQHARLLAALRARGARGVRTDEFLAPDVLDGGKPITRVASRISDLKERGHRIEAHREPNGVARYVLVGHLAPTALPAREPSRPAALLNADTPPPASPYDPEWA